MFLEKDFFLCLRIYFCSKFVYYLEDAIDVWIESPPASFCSNTILDLIAFVFKWNE